MNELTAQDWNKLDDLYEKRTRDTIAWCIGVAEHEERQEDIAERYGLSRTYVAMLAAVGDHADIFVSNADKLVPNLPNGITELHALVSANADGKRLTQQDIKKLCANGRPTRAAIKVYKQNIGLLPPPPAKRITQSDSDLFKVAVELVPRSALTAMSEFGVKAFEKNEQRLNGIISNLTKSQKKEILIAFVEVLNHVQSGMEAEIRRRVKEAIKDREHELNEREALLFKREQRVTSGIPASDKKLIQGILHPDKAPAGQESRYAKAFDAFRKLA